MSFDALKWVDNIETLSPSAKVVLFTLAQYANEHGESWPSQEVLARKSNQSTDSVQRRLKEMVDGGYLHRVKRKSDCGTQITNLYILLMDDATRAYATRCGWRAEDASEGDAPDASGRAADCGPAETPSRAAQRPQPGRTAPVAGPHCCGSNQPNNLSNNPPPKSPVAESEGEGAAAPHFVEWTDFRKIWTFDPSEIPGQAAAEFARLTDDDRALAVKWAPRYIAHCRAHGRKIAHAKSWISGRGWEAFESRSVESAASIGGAPFTVREGSPQAAAWARYETAVYGAPRLRFIPSRLGRICTRPTEWPPSLKAEEGARDGPAQSVA